MEAAKGDITDPRTMAELASQPQHTPGDVQEARGLTVGRAVSQPCVLLF